MHRALSGSVIALMATAAACTGTPASTLGTSTSSSGATGGGGTAASSSSSVGVGGQAARLSDDGLFARYYLDTEEAMPAAVTDAGPEGLDLPVTQSGNLTFGGDPGRRGMSWATPQMADAARQVDPSAAVTALYDGATALTYEVVVNVDASTPAGGRILHYGSSTDSGLFSLHTKSNTELAVAVANSLRRLYLWSFEDNGRTVLHAVVELEAPGIDRVRLYANGSPLAPTYNEPIEAPALTPLETDRLWLGNRDTETRSFNGTLGYAAIYARALDEETIANHVRILLDNDDQP